MIRYGIYSNSDGIKSKLSMFVRRGEKKQQHQHTSAIIQKQRVFFVGKSALI